MPVSYYMYTLIKSRGMHAMSLTAGHLVLQGMKFQVYLLDVGNF
jgi:hypothetical protein